MSLIDHDFYWQEVASARRALLGPAVIVSAALAAMLWATRRAAPALARPLWMAGAVLLGAVVLKLFLVDLSQLGSLARIVSFLAVGALMLVIGYVAPLPPEERTT